MKTPDILIKELLNSAKWTQDELARRLGLPLKTVNSWATGRNEPRAKNLEQLERLHRDIVGRTEVDKTYLDDLKKKALKTHLGLRELLNNEDLLKLAALYLTYHTNTIEGNTMTLADVKTVLDDENAIIANKSYREQAEARNHQTAFLFLLEQLRIEDKDFRWSSALILETHKRLMNSIMDDAGNYRRYGVRVTGSSVKRADYIVIPQKIDDLVAYMNTPTNDVIERLAKTHANFELIHPFGDGNGRTGRLIMFIQAMQYGIVPPLVLKEYKRAYYKYLESADKTGNYDLLAMFIAESILNTDELLK